METLPLIGTTAPPAVAGTGSVVVVVQCTLLTPQVPFGVGLAATPKVAVTEVICIV